MSAELLKPKEYAKEVRVNRTMRYSTLSNEAIKSVSNRKAMENSIRS